MQQPQEVGPMQAKVRRGLLAMLLLLGAVWLGLTLRPLDVQPAEDASALASKDPDSRVRQLSARPVLGSPAPDFTLEDLEGKSVTLSRLQSQVVLINFWATWCVPCREEMPAIQQVYDARREQGFAVLAVNVGEGNAQVKTFVEELELSFPILMDRDGEVAWLYRIQGLPTSFFIDRTGIIRDLTIGGPMSDGLIEDKIADLLSDVGEQE